jgi:hypothetical protein
MFTYPPRHVHTHRRQGEKEEVHEQQETQEEGEVSAVKRNKLGVNDPPWTDWTLVHNM